MTTRTELPATRARGEPKLVFRSGPARGTVLVLTGDRVTLGRAAGNDVVLPEEIVSGRHASIERGDDGRWWLVDEGSKNGTYRNGRRIERAPLEDGDLFCICKTGPEIQFTWGEPELPSLLQTTRDTLSRTRSLESAVRELLPFTSGDVRVSGTAVRRHVDRRLAEVTRRTRRYVVAGSLASAVLGALLAIAAAGGFMTGDKGGGSAAPEGVTLEVEVEPIYGAHFLSYREEPVGRVRVRNAGRETLRNLRVEFLFDGEAASFLLERPRFEIAELGPGEEIRRDIFLKLSQGVLSERDREVRAAAVLYRGSESVLRAERAVFVYGYHVFSWEKPERIGSFIDPEDEAVQAFVKAVWRHRPPEGGRGFPGENMTGAVTVLTGLAERGLRYLPDARTPVAAGSGWKARDRVNYPGETLLQGSGDCDDLTVLAASALEAAGIPTAVVVASDHVLFLFDSGFAEEELESTPLDPATVVPRGGRVWIPCESTELAGKEAGFQRAWAAAWRWREAILAGEAEVVEVQEAWKRYKPLNPPLPEEAKRRLFEELEPREGFAERLRGVLERLGEAWEREARRKAEEAAAGLEGYARAQAVALVLARSGLYRAARETLEGALFAGNPPEDASQVGNWKSRLPQDAAYLLYDLALVAALGRSEARDLELAAAYLSLALELLPPDAPERGDFLLRLALVHRLRGDRARELEAKSRATALNPALERRYAAWLEGEGSVAADGDSVRKALREALGTRGGVTGKP